MYAHAEHLRAFILSIAVVFASKMYFKKKIQGEGNRALNDCNGDFKAAWNLLADVLLLLSLLLLFVLILICVILQEREQQAWAVSPCAVSLKSKVIF